MQKLQQNLQKLWSLTLKKNPFFDDIVREERR